MAVYCVRRALSFGTAGGFDRAGQRQPDGRTVTRCGGVDRHLLVEGPFAAVRIESDEDFARCARSDRLAREGTFHATARGVHPQNDDRFVRLVFVAEPIGTRRIIFGDIPDVAYRIGKNQLLRRGRIRRECCEKNRQQKEQPVD